MLNILDLMPYLCPRHSSSLDTSSLISVRVACGTEQMIRFYLLRIRLNRRFSLTFAFSSVWGVSVHAPWVPKQLLATESGYSESCGMPASKRRLLHVKTTVEKPFASENHSGLACGKKQDRTGEKKVRIKKQRISRVKGGAKQTVKLDQRSQNSREPQGRTKVVKPQERERDSRCKRPCKSSMNCCETGRVATGAVSLRRRQRRWI